MFSTLKVRDSRYGLLWCYLRHWKANQLFTVGGANILAEVVIENFEESNDCVPLLAEHIIP